MIYKSSLIPSFNKYFKTITSNNKINNNIINKMNSDSDFPPLGSKPVRKPAQNNNSNNKSAFSYKQVIPQQSQPVQTTATSTTSTTSTSTNEQSTPTIIKNEIIDIGANLADKSFSYDIGEVLKRGHSKGVTKIIITGTSIRSSVKALELIENNKKKNGIVELYSTVGVHPHEADRALQGGGEKISNEIRQIIKNNLSSVKAVGECGLDFNRNFSTHQNQIEMFDRQIQLGIELNLPLFIHERESHKEFIKVVEKYISQNKMPRSVIHCFTGTEAEAKTYVDMGFYIGFTGIICNKRGEDLRRILSKGIIPLDKLMIETDCPYMTPNNIDPKDTPKQEHNSKFIRNEPSLLPYILKTLAQCYKISESEMALQTFNNTKSFFNLN